MYVINADRQAKLRSIPPEQLVTQVIPTPEASVINDREPIVLIEKRQLFRECIVASFDKLSDYKMLSFSTVEGWLNCQQRHSVSIIIISAGGRSRAEVLADLDTLEKAGNKARLILIAQAERLDAVLEVLTRGARAFIPTSMSMEATIQAIKVVQGGGTYVPASLLLSAQQPAHATPDAVRIGGSIFTHRQAAVIEALRRGKANKIIAYELSMRESTVKVHIRNIMRKLRAKNRTEVAIIANASAQTQQAEASDWQAHQAM